MNVLVVGAGPSGLHLAQLLASNGVAVRVLEQREKIGRKVCSGLLSKNTVKRYRLKDLAENVVHGARIHAGKEMIFVERKNVAYVFDRAALDRALYEMAVSEGARVFFSTRFEGKGVWDLLVGADGFSSTVRHKILRLSPPRFVMGVIAFVRGYFDNYVDIYLDRNLAPGFFAWVIPRSDAVAEIGLGVSQEYSSAVFSYLRRFARVLGFSEYSVLGARPIPIDRPLLRVVSGNVALLGDAANQVKATTGGGISYGLRAADLLADATIRGHLSIYQQGYRKEILPRLLLHYFARTYLNRANPERILRDIKELGLERELSNRGDMDDPYFLLSPRFIRFIFRSVSHVF